MNEIKKWLNDYIRCEFKKDTEYLYKLSPTNLFYLYIEIFKKYNVRIQPEEIDGGCFESIDALSMVISNHVELKKISNLEV